MTETNDPDAQLMLAFKGGDESAFEKLLDKYEPLIINLAYRFTGNRQTAEDLAQEVFLRVYQAAPGYEPTSKFSTWIYRIATNICLDFRKKTLRDLLRKAGPVTVKDESGEEKEIETANPFEKSLEKALEEDETSATVRIALEALPENQRIALVLRVYDDKPYAEIADILGTSVSAVETLLFRARQSLKKLLLK